MKNIWGKLNKKVIATVAAVVFFVLVLLILPGLVNIAKTLLGIPHFERVGDMHYARSGHQAVLLQDGRVLIDGVEIYEPKKRKFKLIDKQYRTGGQTMTVLNNGLVLIIRAYKNSVLFDPKTETSSPTDSLKYPRKDFTATLLQDGRVLIVGGRAIDPKKDNNHQENKLAEHSEIYDPKTGKFEVGPKINVPRYRHGAILLDDGNVLVIGGVSNGKAKYISELYITEENKFIKLKEKSLSSLEYSSPILFKNGKVLINGSDPNNNWEDFLEIYTPEMREFKVYSKNPSRYMGTDTLLKNGNIIYIAGTKKVRWYGVSTKDSTILNVETKEFIKGPDLFMKRSGHTSTLLNDGTVLITGGYDNQTMKSMKTAELYIPK